MKTNPYIIALVFLLSACSGSEAPSTAQDEKTAAEQTPVATKKEESVTEVKTVNVYSSRKEALIKPVLDRFTAATGVQVNLVTGKADALIERLKSEGASSPADLLVTVDAGRLYRAQTAGLTQAVNSEALNSSIPAAYREPGGHWFGLSLRARTIMYAKDRVSADQLSTYEALADDQWQGKICIRSSGNIYNQSLLASMIADNDEASVEAWAKGLVANFARPPVGGDRDQIKGVAAGMCDIAVANTYYLFGMLTSDDPAQKEAAEQLAVFWPNQAGRGTHVNISGIALTQSSKNKEHAIALMEFLVSESSQQWYADANGEYPVRDQVPANSLLAQWGDFKKDDLNLSRLGELNEAAVKVMDRAGWQ